MKIASDLRRWLGGGLKWLFPVDTTEDPITAIQRDAITRNRNASEANARAADEASQAINELLVQMEARRNG